MCHLEYVAICYELHPLGLYLRFRCTISLLCFIRRSSCASICFSQCYIRIWIIFSRFILLKAGAISHYSQENGIERSNVTANPYQRYSNWCYILFNITQRSSFKKSQTYVNIIAKQNIYINNLTHPFVLSWFKRQSLTFMISLSRK